MQKFRLVSVFILFFISVTIAQNYTISGYITDAKSGESLISSSIYDSNSNKGNVSNAYGFYSLSLPKGNVELQYSYVGYVNQNRIFRLTKDTVINILLKNEVQHL